MRELYVGQYAMTPEQMEKAGVIKPGSASLVNSLIQSGADPEKALPPAIFTGKPGAENFKRFITSQAAQTEALAKNLQVAQTSLQNTGIIKGNESAEQVGGLIMAATNNGITNVVENIQLSAAPATNRNINTDLNNTLQNIAQGNYASKLNNNIDALNGSATSIDAALGLNNNTEASLTNRGSEADAFEAIKQSIPKLTPYQPVDLTVVAKTQEANKIKASLQGGNTVTNQIGQNVTGQLLEKASVIGSNKIVNGKQIGNTPNINNSTNKQLLPNKGSMASSLINAARGNLPTNSEELSSILESSTNSFLPTGGLNLDGLQDAAQTVSSGILSTTSGALASGLTNLPGGEAAFSSITNFANGALPEMPGIESFKNELFNTATDALNGLSSSLAGNEFNTDSIKNGLMSTLTSKLPAGAAAILKSAVGSLPIGGSKAASVGINTQIDRAALNNGVKSILEDPGIPAPTYGEVDKAALGKIEEIEKKRVEYIEKNKEVNKELIKANEEYRKAYDALMNSQTSLPQGDMNIGIAEAKLNIAVQNQQQAKQKLNSLYREYPEFSQQSTNNTVSNSTSNTNGGRTLSGDSSTGIGAVT